ncbi:MAG: NAD(P)/FAD-dependent oxidoreductase [Gemmatimonadaceae bacterium]|nr:NAD(P)/FAD-dependent oxidoreductase [Gemmatimonadaceae bacterium]
MPPESRTHRMVIIGGGFAGIGLAIRLRQQGIDDFVIVERAADLGGTWRDNRYPGCACDVQSSLYSFSFAPNPSWSRTFSPQAEIWEYLRACARTFDIERHFVFGQIVTSAHWDAATQQWVVTSATHQWRASILIAANGALSDPVVPSIAGLESFGGRVFHSAQWPHDIDLRNQRVAVIGTGASAIQFVPAIQPLVQQLHLFQRTPPWIMPRRDHAIPHWRRALYRAVPATQRAERALLYAMREVMYLPFRHRWVARLAERAARRHLAAQVANPTLRAKLTPAYTLGCKRILLSDDYFPALTQSNVELVTTAVSRIGHDGIVDADGTLRPVDTIIFGTGFRPTEPPLAPHIVGRDGQSLAAAWQGSPRAYMGTTVAGFPNLFLLMGPNTGLGHSSVILMVEAQIEYVLAVLAHMNARSAGAVEPTRVAQTAYVAWLDARLAPTVWNSGGCRSWYLDESGRNAALWPDRVGAFRRTVTRLHPRDYHLSPRVAPNMPHV